MAISVDRAWQCMGMPKPYFSSEMLDSFLTDWRAGKFSHHLRMGQAFFNHMDLGKVTGLARPWADILHAADGKAAEVMLEQTRMESQ